MKSLSGRIIEFLNSIFSEKKLIPVKVRVVAILLLASGLVQTVSAQAYGGDPNYNPNYNSDPNYNYNPPTWAPEYDNANQVQYYYLPDIESYYDVYNREFVYLDNGNWVFAPQLPQRYAWYDFNSSFSIVLDYSARDPWRYHNFYVEHYPRNYYREMYRNEFANREHYARGFNENNRGLVFRNVNQRHEFIERREMNERREFAQRREMNERREVAQRREVQNRYESNQRHDAPQTHQVVNTQPRYVQASAPQHVEHNVRNIGQPVRVDYKSQGRNEHSGRR